MRRAARPLPGVLLRRKKKHEADSDVCGGDLGSYRTLLGRRPPYAAYLGFWLNRKRESARRAGPVALGAAVALGLADPGLDYWEAQADGKGEALLMKARHESRGD